MRFVSAKKRFNNGFEQDTDDAMFGFHSWYARKILGPPRCDYYQGIQNSCGSERDV